MIMENLSRSTVLFLVFCIVVVLQFQTALQEGGQNVVQNEPENPFLPKFMMDTISLLRRSHKNSWEKIKSILHDLQLQFSPPTLDFRGGEERGIEGVEGTVKEAVGKSLDKSKETVKGSARSAAQVVGDAAHYTAQKLKATASASEQESDAEL